MRTPSHSPNKYPSILLGLFSLAMMAYGTYEQSYWFALGLVLLMPSVLLLTASLSDQTE